MYIDYGELNAFFGDYQRVVYSLSNGCPTTAVHSTLYNCKEGDSFRFLGKLQDGLYWECSINEERTVIYWEDLWNLQASFDERIGAIKEYGMCKIINGPENIPFRDISTDGLLQITANNKYMIHTIFKGYRLNRTNHLVKKLSNEEDAFRQIEYDLFHEKYSHVQGTTTPNKCLEFTLILN